MFRAWDTSGNGSLSHGELKRAMKKEATMKPLLSSESFHWKDVWARYDTNQDGSVGEDEFLRFFVEMAAPCLYGSREEEANDEPSVVTMEETKAEAVEESTIT